jgi:serine/threonine-protein kinase MRCK
MVMNDIPYVVYLANMHTRELINTKNFDHENRIKPKRKFSFRELNKSSIRIGSDRRRIISAPSNFNHISHVGPDIQKQKLFDLPTTVDTIDQPIGQKTSTIRSLGPPRTPPKTINLNNKTSIPVRFPSHTTRSPSPLDSSISSITETIKSHTSERHSESRQSVTSNNSSCSTPPSPVTHNSSG